MQNLELKSEKKRHFTKETKFERSKWKMRFSIETKWETLCPHSAQKS